MPQPIRVPAGSLSERIRAGFGRRAAGILLALLLEGLLVLMLFTLGPSISRRKEVEMAVLSFDAAPVVEQEEAPAESQAQEPRPAERAEPPPEPEPPRPVDPAPVPPPVIPLAREPMPAPVPQPAPATPKRSPMGPPDTGTRGDTPRVGSAPNGEPLYAASWYREPYDDELRGYLSTARGPGWGLIACRTVPDYRVEDCVALGEYPEGSNIARAVLAAAWQFRVRPPRLGGRAKIGEWVRIRIDYEMRRQ